MTYAAAILFVLQYYVRSTDRGPARIRRRFREIAAVLALACVFAPPAEAASFCGDGVVDAGEQCDGGGQDPCCRSDCRYSAEGVTCDDRFECVPGVCDGLGSCGYTFSEGTCNAGDICTLGICEQGECIATELTRDFEQTQAIFHLTAAGMIDSAKIFAVSAIDELGDNPAEAGAEFRLSLGGTDAWQEFIPAGRWMRKGTQTFVYRSSASMPGRIRNAKIRLDPTTRKATYRMKLAAPIAAMPPTEPTLYVLAGSREDGQCATSSFTSCSGQGRNRACQ